VAYGTLDVVARLESVHRTFNRAIVLSHADRGIRTAATVRDARAELRVREDVYGHDALGWALLADGHPRLAVREADAALSLGTEDPRLLVHAGLIHAAAGHADRARTLLTEALRLSPTFDPLLADRARKALADLAHGASS
jgi:Flp pilus assembly protein TadD